MRKGTKHSELTRKKMHNSQLGKIKSQEVKDKISETNSGRKMTEEAIERMLNTRKINREKRLKLNV